MHLFFVTHRSLRHLIIFKPATAALHFRSLPLRHDGSSGRSHNNHKTQYGYAPMMPDYADRRIKERFAAQCLKVNLRERGFFGRNRKPISVCCLDMNRYGMGLLSPRPVEPGSRLFLDFHGKYISEANVRARVIDCYPYQAGFRVSIQFTNFVSMRSYSRAVDNALSRIEGIYNRYVS